jgi:hypothetical protein
MDVSPGVPYYYATWTGYDPPVKPHRPIDYAQAEEGAAFSVFVFDEKGKVASFEKWLATVSPKEPVLPGERTLHAGLHFFSVKEGEPETIGEEILLEGTMNRPDYYRVRVGPDGKPTSIERVHRDRTIRHEYEYWENGKLREVRYDPAPPRGPVERFDKKGKPIDSNLAPF